MDDKTTSFKKQVEAIVVKNLSKNTALDRWQQAFDASPDLISILDKDHRILTINDAMAASLGCQPDQVEGQRCCALVHKSDKPPLGCPHNYLLEDGKSHQADMYDEALDKWMSVHVTPLYDDNGGLIGSIHIARDITRRKQTEQALRESQEQYRHLSEAAMDGVLLSRKGTILLTNQALADMLGYTVDELKGEQIIDFVVPQEHERLIHYMQKSQTDRNEIKGVRHEFTCMKKDGTRFPVEACSRRVTYRGYLINQTAIRDLSHQKQIENERAQRERLQGVLEMAGTICHELNQPLTAIYGYLDLINLQVTDHASLATKIEHIDTQLKRIDVITRKLARITHYKTKAYAGGENIIDLDEATSESTPEK